MGGLFRTDIGYYLCMWMSSKSLWIVFLATATLFAAGCSDHQSPPATPVDSAKTPTFGSSTYSYDQPNSPLYTQAGQNGGKAVSLPSIPPTSRFDQNTPLASEVYGSLQSKLGVTAVRYVTVQSKGAVVLIGGTVRSAADASTVIGTAKTAAGVKRVIDHIAIQS